MVLYLGGRILGQNSQQDYDWLTAIAVEGKT